MEIIVTSPLFFLPPERHTEHTYADLSESLQNLLSHSVPSRAQQADDSRMFDVLLDLLFPRQSLTGAEGSFITKLEQESLNLTPLLLSTKVLRQRGLRYIDDIVAAGQYDESDELKKMILTYKYKRIPVFSDELARRMTAALHGLLLPTENVQSAAPVLCPVPLHWSRLNERGFNQAEQLAVRIAKAKNWRMEELLFRVRRTGHQAHRTRPERLTALLNAFSVKPDIHVPSWVILIDDLSTTGATLDECAKMLKAGGAQRVSGLVAAAG